MKKIIAAIFGLMMAVAVNAQQLAFPGAEGFGAYATGGRGGKVVHVTNLNASGAGSLADAVSQPNRIVVFDVGGVIDISGGEMINISDNITIAGQTAPGEGITIYGNRVVANGKNVIIRYIRMRGSIKMNEKKCTFTCDEASNIILDHCSISWGRWDNVHITNSTDITWQNCIISEGIDPQNFGAITDGTRNWTISHCLWANNKSRNPKLKCYAQQINNVIYNYGNGIVGGHSAADNYQDVIGCYFISGPNTGSDKHWNDWTETDHLYSSGNYTDHNKDGVLNGTLVTDHDGATPMSKPNLKSPVAVTTESAAKAYQTIVETVGASKVRDIHDTRVINQVRSLGKLGTIIYDEAEVGGIGSVAGGTKPKDTDNDGMPDDWETAHGLNPLSAADAMTDADGDGYANIENYINELADMPMPLTAPDGFTATGYGEGMKALIRWSSVDSKTTAVIIEKSTDAENFVVLTTLSTNTKQYIDSELSPDSMYYYRLRATDGTDFSEYTKIIRVNGPKKPSMDKLQSAVNDASSLLSSATPGYGTLQYPEEEYNQLDELVAEAIVILSRDYDPSLTQDQIDKYVSAIQSATNALKGMQILYWGEYDATKVYNIFTYGQHSGSSETTASATVPRRYLSVRNSSVGVGDSLIFKVGLTENDINAGKTDPKIKATSCMWEFTPSGTKKGYYNARNIQYGTYLRIAKTLVSNPVDFYPQYAKDDLGHHAFYMKESADNNYCFNVGIANDAGTMGPVEISSLVADRTRLRWVISEAGNLSDYTSISSLEMDNNSEDTRVFDLSGRKVSDGDSSLPRGLYIVGGKKYLVK